MVHYVCQSAPESRLSFATVGFRSRYAAGGIPRAIREFRAMNVTAAYKMQIQGAGTRLVRQGELQIVPPNFDPQKTRLSASQVALRTILQKKFGKLFEPEIVSEGLVLPGKWKRAGRLSVTHLHSDHGWLAMAWIRGGAAAQTTTVAAASR